MNLRSNLRQKAPGVLGSSNIQLTQAITQIFHEIGGFEGLIKKFSDNGFEDVIRSWISNTTNKTITTEQVKSILGPDLLSGIAIKVGIPPESLCLQVALYLPLLVDRLSPEGTIPQDTWWSRGFDKLKEFFGLSVYH